MYSTVESRFVAKKRNETKKIRTTCETNKCAQTPHSRMQAAWPLCSECPLSPATNAIHLWINNTMFTPATPQAMYHLVLVLCINAELL